MQNSTKPSIGLALSGGSARSIAHIGVLEVLRENNIQIEFITACSSGTLAAAAYACGTMEELKDLWMKKGGSKLLLDLVKFEGDQGIFSTEKFVLWFRQYTHGMKFEDVNPHLGFVCVDLKNAETVVIALGDIVKGVQASCALPGLLEPVEWGNRTLVDGGLFSVIPAQEARDMGADIVIGVDIAATRHVIRKRYLRVWRGYNFFKQSNPVKFVGKIYGILDKVFEKSIKIIFYNQSDFFETEPQKSTDFIANYLRAMELVVNRQKNGPEVPPADMMISPNVKHMGKIDFENSKQIYEEGRRVAIDAIPDIKSLIKDYNWRHKTENGRK